MTRPYIKFCGLTRPEDVETALSLGASFLGFIVECASPRRLSIQQAARLSQPATGLAKLVAVTVNPNDDLIASLITRMKPDAIQLHGEETPKRLRDIKSANQIPLIKAMSISTREDLERTHAFSGVADYLLLDAKPPKGHKQRGGHGHSFDWKLLEKFKSKTPLIIAGGLSPRTIGAARQMTKAHIFDVSSGIESAPGIKDAALMTAFMKATTQE